MTENTLLPYSVGALLYVPALNSGFADKVTDGVFDAPYSAALCLEDAISSGAVERAETQLVLTLQKLYRAQEESSANLPKLFIRVRNPQQVLRVFESIRASAEIITGFIFPKFTCANAGLYIDALLQANSRSKRTVCMMPILESAEIARPNAGLTELCEIKERLDKIKDLVLNIRVGGNDLCNFFGVRRKVTQTIYEILPVARVLTDILTVFSREYAVSGAVWEYFSGQNEEWKEGLERETDQDLLNGIIGKTVIHPAQIPVVNRMLRVSPEDLDDARAILNWKAAELGVEKSCAGNRMNEVNTHQSWAQKILIRSELYGVRAE